VSEFGSRHMEAKGLDAVPAWVWFVVATLVVAPSTFLVWLCAAGAVYAGRARRWHLAVAAPVTALPLVVIEPATRGRMGPVVL
jgi:hypothetical protein